MGALTPEDQTWIDEMAASAPEWSPAKEADLYRILWGAAPAVKPEAA